SEDFRLVANLPKVWIRSGVPPSSVNCLEGPAFFPFPLGGDAMRVPSPAAGIITTTFIGGDKYSEGGKPVQIPKTRRRRGLLRLGSLPQLNPPSLRVGDPSETTVFIVFAMGINLHSFFLQHLQ